MTKLSIISPVYRNEQVETFIKDVQEKVRSKFPDSEFIIAGDVACDGNMDRTCEILKSLQDKYDLTLDICSERRGYVKAVKSVYSKANGDIIFFLDSDGEHDPSDFWELYARFNDGYDVVVGHKTNRRPLYRLFISRINNFLIGILFNIWFKDANCGFRIMKNSMRDFVLQSTVLKSSFNVEMLVRAKNMNKSMAEVPVRHVNVPSVVFNPAKMPIVILESLKELYTLYKYQKDSEAN